MGLSNSTPVARQRNINLERTTQRNQPTREDIYSQFYKLCSDGNVDQVSRYIRAHNINIYEKNNTAFVIACVCNHLELAQWLYYDKSQEEMDIHVNNDAILFHLVDVAPTRIVNWFIRLDVFDLKQKNNAMFHNLCEKNRVDIAKIFEELCQDYRIETSLRDGVILEKDMDENDVADEDLKIVNYHILKGEITELSILKTLQIIPVPHRDVKNDECMVCFEKYVIVLPCQHSICVKCFHDWYFEGRNYSLCMLCKTKFLYDECVYIKNIVQPEIVESEQCNKLQTEEIIVDVTLGD